LKGAPWILSWPVILGHAVGPLHKYWTFPCLCFPLPQATPIKPMGMEYSIKGHARVFAA
jgi:hypothetical protein